MAIYCNQVGFHNPEGCNTGEYDDDCNLDERIWAALSQLHYLLGKNATDYSYVDHAACYSLNEITIYWNSPAVFVTAYFNQKQEKKG